MHLSELFIYFVICLHNRRCLKIIIFLIAGNLMRHMVLHDPDNSVQEKALALKFGRQKKVHVIDGQQVRKIFEMQ